MTVFAFDVEGDGDCDLQHLSAPVDFVVVVVVSAFQPEMENHFQIQ